jgi:hypothetical protein
MLIRSDVGVRFRSRVCVAGHLSDTARNVVAARSGSNCSRHA